MRHLLFYTETFHESQLLKCLNTLERYIGTHIRKLLSKTVPAILAFSREVQDHSASQDLSLEMVFNLSESSMIAVTLFLPWIGLVCLDQSMGAEITA